MKKLRGRYSRYSLRKKYTTETFSLYSSDSIDVESRVQEKVSLAYNKLAKYNKWIRFYSPTVAIEKIMEDVGFFTLLVKNQLGNRAYKNLVQILESMKAAETSGTTTFKGIYDLLYELVMEEVEIVNIEQDEGAVRVMNIHQAKGLEAPIVFLAHPRKQVNVEQLTSKHIKRDDHQSKGYIHLQEKRRWSSKTIALPQNWDEMKAEELRYITEEEMRILYVAATRAKKALIISTSANNDNLNPWRQLLNIDQIEPIEISVEESEVAEHQTIDYDDYSTRTSNTLYWLDQRKDASYETWSPTEDKGVLTIEREHGGGLAWGNAIHEVLEKIVHGHDVKHYVRHTLRKHNLSLEREEEVFKYIQQFKDSRIWKDLQASDSILTEVPLRLKLSPEDKLYSLLPFSEEEKPVYVTGVIDLIYKVDGKWIIVDYKTDRVKHDEDRAKLEDFYRDQLTFYEHAWEQMTGESVKEVHLFFFEEVETYVP